MQTSRIFFSVIMSNQLLLLTYLSALINTEHVITVICAQSPEKAMAPHSSILAWKIPWTEEPGGLQSMGSLRVGHD